MNVDNLVIEVTRRCNAKCGHCLRGTAENSDMSSAHVWELFKRIDRVCSVTFTGGEPSLAYEVIADALVAARHNDVEIGNFYIATNALVVPDGFINTIMDWWQYCDENEITAVHYSNDRWHPKSKDLAANIEKLRVLRFTEAKYEGKFFPTESNLIAEGRALDLGASRDLRRERYAYEVDDDFITEGQIYLNCEGNIIAGCDWSYDSQREKEQIICSVSELSIEKIKEWNDGA